MIYVRVYINWPALAILWCIRITKYHVVYNKYKHLFHVNTELHARRAFRIVHTFMKSQLKGLSPVFILVTSFWNMPVQAAFA